MKWRILCYHTVDPAQAATFARQLGWFRGKGYQFRSMSEALAGRGSTLGSDKWATVTFDDGDASVCTVGQKVLADQGVRALLYLNTDYIARGETYRAQIKRPTCTWDQLQRWLEAGNEIGSHTHTHADLTRCSRSQLEDELEQSRQTIAQYLGVSPMHFSYPWGRHNGATHAWFRSQAQWRTAATVQGGGNNGITDPFRLRRDVLVADWSLTDLYAHTLSRMPWLLYQLGRRATARLQ